LFFSKTGRTDLRETEVQQPKTTAHFVFLEELFGFFSEERPVGSTVYDNGFDLFTSDTALGVDFVEGEEEDVAEGCLGDRHGATQGVEDTDFNGVSGEDRLNEGEAGCGQKGFGRGLE